MTTNAIVRAGFPWWLRPFIRQNTIAITLGRRVYIKPGRENDQVVLRHELVHVRQYDDLGVVRFLSRYSAEYVGNRLRGKSHDEAYRAISLEEEAYRAENDQTV